MKTISSLLFNLPGEEQIEYTEEVRTRSNPGLIRKTIRYRNGMVAVLFQDFQNHVFSIHLKSERFPFIFSANQILQVE